MLADGADGWVQAVAGVSLVRQRQFEAGAKAWERALQLAPNESGVRRVTVMDQNQFRSGCGGLATAIGSGTVSGTTLSSTVDVRCAGSLVLTDVLFTFTAVGDTLVGFGGVWERAGA